MYYYQKGKDFICLPKTKNTKDTNNKIMISLNEIVSIEPYGEEYSKITLSNGKEIEVFEKVGKIFDYLMEYS